MSKANITISDLALYQNSESFLSELKDTDFLIGHIIGGKIGIEISVTIKF